MLLLRSVHDVNGFGRNLSVRQTAATQFDTNLCEFEVNVP
jgi:hypothetical protein